MNAWGNEKEEFYQEEEPGVDSDEQYEEVKEVERIVK